MPEQPSLLSLREAARIAGLSPHTLLHAVQRGRLRAFKPGHDWLTTEAWLHEYLDSRPARFRRPGPDGPAAEGDDPR